MLTPAEYLDLTHTAHPKLFESQNYVWEALKQIASYLQQKQQEELEVALANKLRTSGGLKLFLREPEAPIMNVSLGTGASRGDVNSPVTVVEFTDFQCSACGAMYPILEDSLKTYGNRVRFVVRNFPLTSVHANAFRAASPEP